MPNDQSNYEFNRLEDRPPSVELQELQRQIAEIEAERDRVIKQINADLAAHEAVTNPIGVFS